MDDEPENKANGSPAGSAVAGGSTGPVSLEYVMGVMDQRQAASRLPGAQAAPTIMRINSPFPAFQGENLRAVGAAGDTSNTAITTKQGNVSRFHLLSPLSLF